MTGAAPGSGSGGASRNAALVYFIKAFVGPGCLSLPLAFQNAGLGLGLGTLLVLAVGVTHNLRSLILCKRFYEGASTYADVAECAVGPRAKRGIEFLVNLVQLGVCTVYFDFFGENVRALLPPRTLSSRALMVTVFPIYYGLALLRDVKTIAPYAALANALIFFAIGIVLFAAAAEIGAADEPGFALSKPATLPLFFGTVVYSFEGVCSMLPVENALKHKADVFPVLYLGMGVVTVAYASVGAVCYVAWPAVSSGSITAEIAAQEGRAGFFATAGPVAANIACVVAVIFTFPVQLFPAIELLEGHFFLATHKRFEKRSFEAVEAQDDGVVVEMVTVGAVENPMHTEEAADGDDFGDLEDVAIDDDAGDGDDVAEESKAGDAVPEAEGKRATMPPKRAAFRLLIVFLVFVAAIAVPDLGALIALLGAVTGSILSLVAPAIINRRCPREKRPFELPADVAFLVVGVVGGALGSYQALLNIVRDPDSLEDEVGR